MGTEVQSKTYFPGFYSTRDLNDNVGDGVLPLYHKGKTLKNGQNYDRFLTRAAIDGYLWNDKEQLRQIILEHERIFRYQLQELHHLYKRQKDLMNEIGRRELENHSVTADTSWSSLYLTNVPSRVAQKTCSVSNLSVDRSSTSGSENPQDPSTFIKGKISESLEYKCGKIQKSKLNLELPADLYTNEEGSQLEEKVFGVSGVENYPFDGNFSVINDRDGNFSVSCGLVSGYDGADSKYLRKTNDIADLNEPIKIEGTSASASIDNGGDITCPQERIQRDASVDLSSNFHLLFNESSKSTLVGKDRKICLNNVFLKSEMDQAKELIRNVEAGQVRCDTKSFLQVFCSEDTATPVQTSHAEPRKAYGPSTSLSSNRSNTDTWRKRKIFGVEIFEGNHNQSIVANTEPSFISQWKRPSSSLNQDLMSGQENPSISISDSFCQNSCTLMQSPGIVGEGAHVGSSLRLDTSSVAESSCQIVPCLGSQLDVKGSPVCRPSIGSNFPSYLSGNFPVVEKYLLHDPMKCFKSSDCMGVKSVPHHKLQDGVIPQQNLGSVDAQRMHESQKRALPWLKANAFSSGGLSKGREHNQMNLDSLKNSFQQFAHESEIGNVSSQSLIRDSSSSLGAINTDLKTKVCECPNNRKILGFSTFDVPNSSKDQTSLSSPSMSSGLAYEVHGDSTTKDLALDHKCGVQPEEKGVSYFISGLKHQIDLNLCLNEEEPPSAPSLPRAIVKIAATEVDLDAPAVLESELDPSPEADSPRNRHMEPSKLSFKKFTEAHEDCVRFAAEAIMAISLSDNIMSDASCHSMEASSCDSLHWLAEVISSYEGVIKGDISANSAHNSDCYESIPDGMDYFEFMTLKLMETKLEEHCHYTLHAENEKDEETEVISLQKRARRGQARRGRHRKDFQRDILPGLVCLSKHEVTEDIQTIEELFRTVGCSWQSNLSRRNAAKNCRGRRRARGVAPSLAASAVSPAPVQQPIHIEQGIKESCLTGWEKTLQPIHIEQGFKESCLTGWGKRTKRLPRQRWRAGNPSLTLKC